ncbi:MAG: peptide chain release factor 2 [Bacilli bacterium]|nr:peptide chain release factor 2 [Bacilli bacterium]
MGGLFDLEEKLKKIHELENKLNKENIWNNPVLANNINFELINLKKIIENYNQIQQELNEYHELLLLSEEIDIVNEIENNLKNVNKMIDEIEIETLLNGKYDSSGCYLEIHPGAGGTEACDWASILLRMYEQFCNKNGYNIEVINIQAGDEAGIKSAIIKIIGKYAYGYFKGEQGVHRLVRISPFDSGGRRHTSFAAISVIPEINNISNINIKNEDVRVDVYRSSGKGGQGVNTTDSAVRLTHLPSGIVVTCQNERSQIKNKETAMKILISKLEQLKEEQHETEKNNLKGNQNINFGSQIRSYTLEPYKLIKDLRTGYETSNTEAVLNGDILPFMEEFLRIKR